MPTHAWRVQLGDSGELMDHRTRKVHTVIYDRLCWKIVKKGSLWENMEESFSSNLDSFSPQFVAGGYKIPDIDAGLDTSQRTLCVAG